MRRVGEQASSHTLVRRGRQTSTKHAQLVLAPVLENLTRLAPVPENLTRLGAGSRESDEAGTGSRASEKRRGPIFVSRHLEQLVRAEEQQLGQRHHVLQYKRVLEYLSRYGIR